MSVELRERFTTLIEAHERRARGAEVAWDSYAEARFAVLAWVDALVLTSLWPSRSQRYHLMLAQRLGTGVLYGLG
jgi:type VI protein secretion system component VasF